jgi:hypothetical protein
MDYARYRAQHFPIGLGVTEAACKTLEPIPIGGILYE